MPVTLGQVVVGNVGGPYLQLIPSGAIQNPGGCGTPDSYVLRDPTLLNHGTAIALTAKASEKPVRIYVTDTCDGPTGRPQISAVGVMD